MIERKRTGFNRYRWECDVPGCPYSGSTDTLTRASVAPAVARRTEAPGSRERGDELVPVSRRPRCEHLALHLPGGPRTQSGVSEPEEITAFSTLHLLDQLRDAEVLVRVPERGERFVHMSGA